MEQGRSAPEYVVCDTTFVSIMRTARGRPQRIVHWPTDVLARLDRAVLAISVVTLAELRAGHIRAEFPPERVARHMETINTYLPMPLDMDVVECWAALDAQRKDSGQWGVDDNDLWIIATAQARGWPVVSSDYKWLNVPDLALIYLPSTRQSPAP